jgi:hypothetical protein
VSQSRPEPTTNQAKPNAKQVPIQHEFVITVFYALFPKERRRLVLRLAFEVGARCR